MAKQISQMKPGGQPFTALVCPQSVTSIHTLEWLKRRHRINYITWMMDDHLVRYQGGRWEYPDGVKEVLGKHLREANTLFVISPTMGEFYEKEFGIKSQTLFGPAERVEAPVYESPSKDGRLRIAYFGKLWRWQLDGLGNFARALRPGKEVLHVYTPDKSLPEALRVPTVELKAPVSKETVCKAMCDYDAIIIPMSFCDAERPLTEFNIATKMSECLASGTVTIVFGPEYAAMVRFLQPTGAACVLTEESLTDWLRVAVNLRDSSYRHRVLDAARDLVQRELSTSVMRGRWREAVSKLSGEI